MRIMGGMQKIMITYTAISEKGNGSINEDSFAVKIKSDAHVL